MTTKIVRRSEDVAKITSLYIEGYSTRKVAVMLNMSPTVVSGIVKDAGISRDRIVATHLLRDVSVPRDWSFSPLTPEKAWLLGLLFGDGSLDKQGYLITLTSGDRDVIDHANQIMGGRIGVRSRQTHWDLQIGSKRLWQELHTLYSLTPNKSRIIQYPDISHTMKPHFVRGLVDSDGCWSSDKRSPKPRLLFFYFSLSLSFVEGLRTDLVSYVGVSSQSNIIVRPIKSGLGYVLSYRNQDALKVGEWVYAFSSDATRCKRKYEYWLNSA
jgi:hypothetical protein